MDWRPGATWRFPASPTGENPHSVRSASSLLPGRLDDMATDRHRLLSNVGPNWFASVMGTGIVATAGATLPVHVPGLRVFAEVVWVLAAVWLLVLVLVVGGHWLRHPNVARSHAHN